MQYYKNESGSRILIYDEQNQAGWFSQYNETGMTIEQMGQGEAIPEDMTQIEESEYVVLRSENFKKFWDHTDIQPDPSPNL